MQVGHQGDSEAVGEHQLGSYGIHYHSVRHGTVNECRDNGVSTRRWDAHTNTDTHTQTVLYMLLHTIEQECWLANAA